ncbi:hypothetical protein [Pedobacter sp. Leaf170]|uniref:hypothetical protein n=1 Tax=Pedobacter sp. Leaf170 TaxID=2876558 RepID=UPI001E429486|nr:hypothetical protein [Pedobacter sp. Leaf170]
MVVQYPNDLKYSSSSAESVYDQESGTWSAASPGVEQPFIKCRAEMNDKGRLVASNDGTQLEYSYTVYMTKDCPVFNFGQIVEVHNSDGLLIKSSVKKFSRGQLNARLWV